MPWTHRQEKKANCMHFQIEEMYSVPESFLEIEVRNPQTHGEFASCLLPLNDCCASRNLYNLSKQDLEERCTQIMKLSARSVQRFVLLYS